MQAREGVSSVARSAEEDFLLPPDGGSHEVQHSFSRERNGAGQRAPASGASEGVRPASAKATAARRSSESEGGGSAATHCCSGAVIFPRIENEN